MKRRPGKWVQAANNLKARGLLDDEQDGMWLQLDLVHREGYRSGLRRGVLVGGCVVLGVVALGWLL